MQAMRLSDPTTLRWQEKDRCVYPTKFGITVSVLLAISYSFAFAILTLIRHASFNTHAFDLGVMYQVTWNTLHGRWFQYTYMLGFRPGLTNYLGDHVRLILIPLSWLYLLYDGPETLLVVQALVVGSSAIPLYLLGRRWLQRDVPSLAFAALFLIHPATQAANLFDFHPILLASSFLIWMFYFAEAKSAVGLAVTGILILSCKENMALVVALFGIKELLHRRIRSGIILLVSGIAWFCICYYLVPHAFGVTDQPTSFSRYSYLGKDPWDLIHFLLTNPVWIVQRLTEEQTINYLAGIFVPLGGLSLLAPHLLLVAASELGLNILSSFPPQRTIDYQYTSIIIAVASVAALEGARLVIRLFTEKLYIPRRVPVALLAVLPVTASLGFQYKIWGTIRCYSASYRESYIITDHDRLAPRFFGQIPPDAPVSAQSDLAPHVSQRPKIYLFPVVQDAEYIILDITTSIFPVQMFRIDELSPLDSYREYVRRLLRTGDFHIQDCEDGWILMAKGPGVDTELPRELAEFLED